MGNPFGDGESQIRDRAATARNQATSDARRDSEGISKWLQLFNGGATNPNFQQSLSGYYGGAPMEDIAKKVALTGTFKPKVKPVMKNVGDDGGLMGMAYNLSPGSPGIMDLF